MGAPVEQEIKLRVDDAAAVRQALVRIGARCVRERHFEDNLILDDPRHPLTTQGTTLRLRRTAGKAVLTLKGPASHDQGIRSRPESEVEVANADVLESILVAIGLRPLFRYQKYRETFRLKDVEIVVDETPIGTYLEIEGPAAGIHDAAAALGYGPADYLTDSYASLYLASGGTGDMVF